MSVKNELRGTIFQIFPPQTITPKLTKSEFILKTEDQYPQEIKIELINQNTALINKYKVGDKVSVDLNIRGRKASNGQWYNSIQAWKISHLLDNPSINMADQNPSRQEEVVDDMPF